MTYGYLRVSNVEQNNNKFQGEILLYSNKNHLGHVSFIEEIVTGVKDWKQRELGTLSAVFEWERTAISQLKELLLETKAFIVISSSWRFHGETFLKALLAIHGLDKFYRGSTIHIDYPDSLVEKDIIMKWRNWKSIARAYYEKKYQSIFINERIIEISEYLDRFREITSFAVLDDENLIIDYGFVKTNKPLVSSSDLSRAYNFL